MIIGGIQISAEAIGAILLGFGGMLTAIGIWMRAKAKKTEADAQEKLAAARIKEADAETARKKAEAEIKERADLLEMIRGQSRTSARFLRSLQKIRQEKEEDYATLRNISDSNTQLVVSEVQKSQASVLGAISALDTTIQTSKNGWIETVAGEFAVVLAAKLNEQMVLQTQYPFPSSSDPDWIEDFVKPIVATASVYNRPYASEETKSSFSIHAEGDNVDIIRGWKKDWLAVRFTRGQKAVFGWVQEHEVRVGVPAVKLATSEVQAANLTPVTVIP